MRNRIWYLLVETKTNEYYAISVTKFYQVCEWLTNTFLVVATSAGVAAWVTWQKHPFLWIVIIGGSQLLTLIKPFLGFPKYVKTYNEKSVALQNIACDLENLWYQIERNKITEEEAERDYNSLKKRIVETDRFPDEVIVFQHTKALIKAENRAESFLSRL